MSDAPVPEETVFSLPLYVENRIFPFDGELPKRLLVKTLAEPAIKNALVVSSPVGEGKVELAVRACSLPPNEYIAELNCLQLAPTPTIVAAINSKLGFPWPLASFRLNYLSFGVFNTTFAFTPMAGDSVQKWESVANDICNKLDGLMGWFETTTDELIDRFQLRRYGPLKFGVPGETYRRAGTDAPDGIHGTECYSYTNHFFIEKTDPCGDALAEALGGHPDRVAFGSHSLRPGSGALVWYLADPP